MRLKKCHYLMLCQLLLMIVGMVSFHQTANAIELMKWERIPLQIPLSIGQERIVFVNKNVRVGFPSELNDKLRIQSAGGAVYLRASAEFSTTRLQLQNVENGELILLDVSATPGKQIQEPVSLIYQGEVSHATADNKTTVSLPESGNKKSRQSVRQTIATPVPVVLTRYAAQHLYAPLRTVEPLAGIHTLAHGLPTTITTLLPSEPVTISPLAAWGVKGYNVVALKITHIQSGHVVLDPRDLQGTFYSATFQHRWLGPAGTPEDTTVLYLVIKGQPHTAFLPEPKEKATGLLKLRERTDAN